MADLGGLGAREGQPITYNWTLSSLLPPLLPWLGILLLLAVKSNRCGTAWWIWAPLGAMGGVAWLIQNGLEDPFSELVEVPLALAFGLAAVWLLAAPLRQTHRLKTLLLLVVTLAGFSVAGFVIKQGSDFWGAEGMGLAITTAVAAAVTSVALSLGGRLCRHRYSPLRVCVWLLAALVAVLLVVITPFFIWVKAFSPRPVPILVLFGAVGTGVGICFGALLPFLVLAFANGLFRERFEQLLHLEPKAPPPITPAEAALTTAAGAATQP